MGDRDSSASPSLLGGELPARVKPAKVRVKAFRSNQSHAIHAMVKALGGSGNPWAPNLASFLKPGIPGAAGDTEELTQPYIQEAWIAAAVDFIALTWALVRPRLWDRDPDDDAAQEITEGPVIELLRKPTPGLDWLTWRVEDAVNINLFNESFHFLLDANGNPVTTIGDRMDAPIDLPAEIVPVKGTSVTLEINRDNGRPKFWRVKGPKGDMFFAPGAVVLHGQIRDPARPYRFIGPTAKAWGAASMRYLANRYQGFLLRNAGDPGGIVSVDGNLAPGEVQRMQDELANEWGDPERAGDWRLLWGGAKLERSKSTPKDLEWPTVHELTKEDISAVFGVSGSLLGKKDENFATFQGHWKMYVETRAIPMMRIDEGQWASFFSRLRQTEFKNYRIRYDTEILDNLFATLEEKGKNAKTFFGMGMPLNESLRQAGMKTDPIEGGDVAMLNQGIRPMKAGIALGQAEAATALQDAGVPGQEALDEVGLGHLTWVKPEPEPAPMGRPPTDSDQPKPDDGADHSEEDRAIESVDTDPKPTEKVHSDRDGHEEWKHVQAIQTAIRSKLDRGLKRVIRQMEVAQLNALAQVSNEGTVDRAAAFDFRKSLVRYRDGDQVDAPPVYPEYEGGIPWPSPEALAKALHEDVVEEARLIAERSDAVLIKASCCGAEKFMSWRPRLRALAMELGPAFPVQRLEDWHYLTKTDLTELQIELLILITDRKWVNALADRIEPATVEMYGLAVQDLATSWGVTTSLDILDPQMLINMRAHAIDVAEGTMSVLAQRLRSDLIRVLAGDDGSFQSVRAAIENSLSELSDEISSTFKSHQTRALAIARTEIGRAAEAGRLDELHELFRDGIIRDMQWLTSLGPAVRPSHQTMHGQTRKPGHPFTSGDGVSLRHPLDPNAPAKEVVNCNCSLIGREKT